MRIDFLKGNFMTTEPQNAPRPNMMTRKEYKRSRDMDIAIARCAELYPDGANLKVIVNNPSVAYYNRLD